MLTNNIKRIIVQGDTVILVIVLKSTKVKRITLYIHPTTRMAKRESKNLSMSEKKLNKT